MLNDLKIFTILDKTINSPVGQTRYYLKYPNKPAKKTNSAKWFMYYDQGVEVLPPLTIEN